MGAEGQSRSPVDRRLAAGVLAIIAGAVAIIGAALPWAGVEAGVFASQVSGTSLGPGVEAFVLGGLLLVVGMLMFFTSGLGYSGVTAMLLSAVIGADVAMVVYRIARVNDAIVDARLQIAAGLIITGIGAAVGMVAGVTAAGHRGTNETALTAGIGIVLLACGALGGIAMEKRGLLSDVVATEVPSEPATAPVDDSIPSPTTTARLREGSARAGCDDAYQDICVPPPPPDLDCVDIAERNFRIPGADPHRFDAEDDGVGCDP